MNLAAFQVKPALRNKWEAIDLGILLARRWYFPLFLSWLIPSALVFFPMLLLFPEMAWLASLVAWWLKPLFDRMPLFLLSRYIFGEHVSIIGARKNILSLFWFDALPALTWRRLDLQRSFKLAVSVLERQKGKDYGGRCTLLQRNCGGAATWLTLIMVHIEVFLCCAFVVGAFLFIPESVEIDFYQSYSSHPMLYEMVYYGLYFVSAAFIAPFYVACGFSLYINRRIELEAWDLEITFRHCVQQRIEKSKRLLEKSGASLLGIGLLVCVLSLVSISPRVVADPLETADATEISDIEDASIAGGYESIKYSASDNSPQQVTRQRILDILQSPPFVIEETKTVWEWKAKEKQPEEEYPKWVIWLARSLEKLFGISSSMDDIASVLEVILWALVIMLVMMVIYRFRRHLQLYWSHLISQQAEPLLLDKPEVIMGMKITHKSLPEDIPTEAKNLWQQGQVRQALAMLYRGSLYQLVYRHDMPLAEWYTEQECNVFVKRRAAQAIANYFGQLTHTWQNLAYAHHEPDVTSFELLCQGWIEVFDGD